MSEVDTIFDIISFLDGVQGAMEHFVKSINDKNFRDDLFMKVAYPLRKIIKTYKARYKTKYDEYGKKIS